MPTDPAQISKYNEANFIQKYFLNCLLLLKWPVVVVVVVVVVVSVKEKSRFSAKMVLKHQSQAVKIVILHRRETIAWNIT